jgi:hypothetical protein
MRAEAKEARKLLSGITNSKGKTPQDLKFDFKDGLEIASGWKWSSATF